MDEIRFVAATGAVGAGVDRASLAAAMKREPHFMAADAGTTDAGPAALGSGVPAFAREAVKADLTVMLEAGHRAHVPVIVGSAGTAGADVHVDWTLDIVREVCAELEIELRVAVIRSEQHPEYLVEMLSEGRIHPLAPSPHMDEATIRRSVRVVGMMGIEPIQRALATGADLVLAGRASDSALYAAMPITLGFPEGLAWHVGKVVECGTLACETRGPGVMLATIRRDHAIIEPIGPDLRCTPMTVAAHSLYENPDPYLFHEASGTLDIRNAVFHAETDTSVRISGAQFHAAEKYNVKLEGAELAGYATVMIGGIRDPFILSRLDVWLGGITRYFERTVKEVLGLGPDDYQFALHTYGRDGVMGELEPERESQVHEVGVVFEVLAADQRTATEIAKLARQPLLHFPVPEWTGAVTTIAYLHNPPQIERGPVYRFNMHHVVTPRTREEMFRIESIEVGAGSASVRTRTA
ncbi:MAG TPA: acyclic terpene utilization AtuA family protein [Candidatus Dormibacteraeota bacterium]|nr:acyclic terpene utilization AtuA family protein [Candidatus Dormibacteraeota bacterium]